MVEDDAWDLTVDQGAAWVCPAYSPRSLTRFMPTLCRLALEHCTPVAGSKPTNCKKTDMGQRFARSLTEAGQLVGWFSSTPDRL